MSLANTAFTLQTTDNEVTVTARALEGAGIDWLGMHAKKHHMMAVGGGKRVGLLAFCGVHRGCADSNTLPFSPVKYSSKVAKSAVQELKEVSNGREACIEQSLSSIESLVCLLIRAFLIYQLILCATPPQPLILKVAC